MAISRTWNLDRLTHDLHENIFDSLSMLVFDSKPIKSKLTRLGGGLLCFGVAHFLKLLGGAMELNPKLDVSALSDYLSQFLSDFVHLSALWVFVAGLPTIAFVIETIFSEAWNSKRKMIDIQSADGSISEGDGKCKENSPGEVSEKMPSWNRNRSLKGGNSRGTNSIIGPLNNCSRYTSPSGIPNGDQLLWRRDSGVSNRQGSDITQQKYILPKSNPDAFKYRTTHMAPSIDERVPPYTVLPPSRPRNIWSQQDLPPLAGHPAPTWSEDYVQAQIDSIVTASMTSPARREKLYCDKWIHEGVCAFAQVGCKYLHVMPMDAETQVEVGLYNGLPRWYRVRTQDWRQPQKPANNCGNNSVTAVYNSRNGGWGNCEASFGSAQSFGPIAPPNKPRKDLV